MTTLLEKALKAPGCRPNPRRARQEKIDLALAYASGEISCAQVTVAFGKTARGSNMYSQLGSTLMSALRQGEVGPIPKRLKHK